MFQPYAWLAHRGGIGYSLCLTTSSSSIPRHVSWISKKNVFWRIRKRVAKDLGKNVGDEKLHLRLRKYECIYREGTDFKWRQTTDL